MTRRRQISFVATCAALCLAGAFFLSAEVPLAEATVRASAVEDFDIALIAGRSLRSRVVRLFGGKVYEWSHVGILRKEGDSVFLLHATPDARGGNAIRYEPLDMLFTRRSVSGIRVIRQTGITPEQWDAIRDNFEKARAEIRPFDYAFDMHDHSTIYCSELILMVFPELACDVDTRHAVHPSVFGTLANSITVLTSK